jgi:hypothetical protein
MGADDDCRRGHGGAVAFVREDARRAPAPDAQDALGIAPFRFAPSPLDLGSSLEPGARRLLEERPLAIALRI